MVYLKYIKHNQVILVVILLLGFIVSSKLFAADNRKENPKSAYRILISNINVGKNFSETNQQKVLAAINLAASLTGNHRILSTTVVDSIIKLRTDAKLSVDADTIAKLLDADYILYAVANKFVNIVRVDLVLKSKKANDTLLNGSGYDNISHKFEKTDSKIYDPALLSATQRAFCKVLRNNSLYDEVNDVELQKKPVPTISVGGLEYIDNSNLLKWDIFYNKVESSYDACEVIVETLNKSKKYAVFDIETRDSIFSLFRLYVLENYNAVTDNELDAIQKFDVQYYVTGKLIRNQNGALLQLYMMRLKDGKYYFISDVEETITEDKTENYRNVLRALVNELLRDVELKEKEQ
jgi:hypothetical protein